MERMVNLAVFLPLVCAQIIFPDDIDTSIASTHSSTSVIPGSDDPFLSSSVAEDVTVDMTEVIPQGQDIEQLLPSAPKTLPPEMNLTVISNLKPVASRIPGIFSSQHVTITPTLKPSLVAFSSTVSSSSGVFTGTGQESLPSRTLTSTEATKISSIPLDIDQVVTRITPRPTFVIRTSIPLSVGASDITQSSTRVPQESFLTPNPVGLNPEPSQSNSDGTPFIQSSQTDAAVPSTVTPTLSLTTTSIVSTSTLRALEESHHQGEQDSSDSFQGITTTIAVDTSTPVQEVNSHVVISAMENKDEPLNDGVNGNQQPCTTPMNETGNCTQLTNCQAYSRIRGKTDSSIAVNFLRGRVCRILPRSLLFCCPNEDPILPIGF